MDHKERSFEKIMEIMEVFKQKDKQFNPEIERHDLRPYCH